MTPRLENVPNYGHPQKLAYKWFFYRHAVRGILRKHRVVYSHPRIGRDRRFYFYPQSKANWDRLYDVPRDTYVPFTFHSHSGAVGLFKVIAGLGVNFKYLMHLKNEIWFEEEMVPGEAYEIDYHFEEVVRIKDNKAAIIGNSVIRKGDVVCRRMRDHFVIREVPLEYAERLRWDESQQFHGLTRLPAEAMENARVREIYITGHLPIRYAKTSGDYLFVHIYPLTARMFGFERPFIQGLCTANLIIKELSLAGIRLNYFSIIFSRPVWTRSQVFLYYNDHEYRLQDAEQHILCFGLFNQQ